MPEARSLKLCGHGEIVRGSGCCVVIRLGFSRRDVADGFEQTPVIEPVDPFQCCELDGFKGTPGSPPVDHFGLVESVDRFGERVVVAVTDTADRRLDASGKVRAGGRPFCPLSPPDAGLQNSGSNK